MKQIPFSIPATILGVAIVVSALIGAVTFRSVRSLDNTLVVTGSAKQAVTADNARWSISTNRVVFEGGVSGAYLAVSGDTTKIKDYLVKNGVKAEEISISPIFVDDYWGPEQVRKLNVRQTITVKTEDVERVKAISENLTVLAQQGVTFSPEQPQYYVSSLPELRVSLLGAAVDDARARAESIGKSTGQRIGKLKSASSGVVQVLQPNSIDVSDYGQYDTSTIEKDVMVTVRATFLVK